MRSRSITITTLAILSIAVVAQAQQGPQSNPFASPQAKFQYVPDRDYDLLRVALDLSVDSEELALRGVVVNTLAPLREGLTTINLHCGANLNVETCEISGRKAEFVRGGDLLKITSSQPLTRGKQIPVTVRYSSGKENRGFRWVKPTSSEPQHVGFSCDGQPVSIWSRSSTSGC